jgi:hypothetical protein
MTCIFFGIISKDSFYTMAIWKVYDENSSHIFLDNDIGTLISVFSLYCGQVTTVLLGVFVLGTFFKNFKKWFQDDLMTRMLNWDYILASLLVVLGGIKTILVNIGVSIHQGTLVIERILPVQDLPDHAYLRGISWPFVHIELTVVICLGIGYNSAILLKIIEKK